MELDTATIGILLLLGVSLVARILPSLIDLKLSQETQEDIKSILPTAVFINLIVYCTIQEINKSLYAAIFAILFIVIVFRKIGILSSVLSGTLIYLFLAKSSILALN